MSEQQMANYTLTVIADSGYECTTEGQCTADQYGDAIAALHGTSPQRTWVGLTDEDLANCNDTELKQALYWEAKLKEKNT